MSGDSGSFWKSDWQTAPQKRTLGCRAIVCRADRGLGQTLLGFATLIDFSAGPRWPAYFLRRGTYAFNRI